MTDHDPIKDKMDDLFEGVQVISLGSMSEFKARMAQALDVPTEPLTWHDEAATPALGRRAEPFDPGCGRYASDIPGVVMAAEDNEQSPGQTAREDGTYNEETNHFLCDSCYIQAGQPTASGSGWKCP